MHPTPEQILGFEHVAAAKGAPLTELISCLPDGCDDEDTIWVLARGTTKSEARELLPALVDANEQAIKNHAMVVALAIWMPGGETLTGGDIVRGVNTLHDCGRQFIWKIVDESLDHLGACSRDQLYSEVISTRTTEEDAAKFGLPPSVLTLRDRYQAPGALRMVRAEGLPSVVLLRPTGDAEARFDRDARGNRMWGSYIMYAQAHTLCPDADDARRAMFEARPGYALPLVGVLQKMRSGGARDEGKGAPRPSMKHGG